MHIANVVDEIRLQPLAFTFFLLHTEVIYQIRSSSHRGAIQTRKSELTRHKPFCSGRLEQSGKVSHFTVMKNAEDRPH